MIIKKILSYVPRHPVQIEFVEITQMLLKVGLGNLRPERYRMVSRVLIYKYMKK